jgi:1,4-dihydroxy-2-naphthoate octaprenyltransferase
MYGMSMANHFNTVLQATRPKFLILAPICVFAGIAAVDYQGFEIDAILALSCLLVALFAHMSVNLLNEYHDAQSGLDDITQKTPFSGGSGALQSVPSALRSVRFAAWTSALFTCLVGVYIILQVNPWLSVLGIIGVAIVALYTPWINKSPWLCLISPGIGFGLLMVNGTYIALAGSFDIFALLISIPIFCLVNNLLLLNQFPDAQADKTVGRRHFVIANGYKQASFIYLIFAICAYSCIAFMVMQKALPIWALALCIGLPISILVTLRARQFTINKLQSLLPFMATNVAMTLLLPMGLALVMISH